MLLPQLYKRATNGKVSTWQIEVEGNKFRAISGYIDGIKTTGSWTECFGKNVGKKNSTTDEEQALAEAISIHKKKIELGAFDNLDDIDNGRFYQPMLAEEFEERLEEITYPAILQPKFDGIRSVNKYDGQWSRNGKKIISAPHIYAGIKHIFESDIDLILDGELYADIKLADFNKIISCVRKSKPTPAHIAESKNYIKLYVYDFPSHEGTFIERYEALQEMFKTYPELNEVCVLVENTICNNEEEVYAQLQKYIDEGYEGAMIRIPSSKYENKRSKGLLKLKRFITDEFQVLGVIEGKGKLKGKVGKLIFSFNNNPFDCAVNGDHEYLEELFKSNDLIGKMATIRYQELTTTDKPVPRFGKVIAIRDYE